MINRKLLYSLIFFCLIALFFGLFFDLQISQAIFINREFVGVFCSAILGPLFCYGGLSFLGGMLFSYAKNLNKYSLINKIISFITIIVSIIFLAIEFKSVNGFNIQNNYKYFAYLYALIISLSFYFLGIYNEHKNQYEKKEFLTIIYFILAIYLFSLVFEVTILKNIIHRVRFRSLVSGENGLSISMFTPIFKGISNYKDFLSENITKEEFKSFPSGHAAYGVLSCIFFIYFPKLNKNFKVYSFYLNFLGIFLWLFICFSRMWIGAHFLSDVAFGSLITLITIAIFNEIYLKRIKNVINN